MHKSSPISLPGSPLTPGSPICGSPVGSPVGPFCHVAPAGTRDCAPSYHGRHPVKPWDYSVTAVVPHLDTLEELKACVALLRAQTIPPYILIIDTGSPPATAAKLEAMRAADLEIHYIAGHGYEHSSEVVCAALDLAHSLCRTRWIFHTHADCFLRRRDLLETWLRITNANTPAVGYRMSPRDWPMNDGTCVTDWQWMIGHVAAMFYMPSIYRAGATWSMRRALHAYGIPFNFGLGWPDTEVGFNYGLRAAGVAPVFLGFDRNFERQTDDNIDHVRSHTGARLYCPDHHAKTSSWMREAIAEAYERVAAWKR